jgi:hypothetical protein
MRFHKSPSDKITMRALYADVLWRKGALIAEIGTAEEPDCQSEPPTIADSFADIADVEQSTWQLVTGNVRWRFGGADADYSTG